MALDELQAFANEADAVKRLALIRQITPSILSLFDFPELDASLREDIWANCFHTLNYSPQDSVCVLDFVRILSRDRTHLDAIFEKNPSHVGRLVALAKLTADSEERVADADAPIVEASLKCLGNIGKQSKVGLEIIASDETIRALVKRLDSDVLHAIRAFDIRLLFLVTALKQSTRQLVRRECHGLEALRKVIGSVVGRGNTLGGELGDRPPLGPLDLDDKRHCVLADGDTTFVCDVLKVLYNLTLTSEDIEEEKNAINGLATSMRQLLLSSPMDDPLKKQQLVSNIMNLLTTVPPGCFQKLIEVPDAEQSHRPGRPEDDGEAMKPVAVLLALLDLLLSSMQESNVFESLFPTLLGMSRMAKANSSIRRYLRREVLPGLRKFDIMKKPEEGSKLRNKLVKLLTNPSVELKDAAASFLFVLCKENVGRMVKHTGFGNAAGMLSARGLIGGRRSDGAADYSSDSMSDSDTEDYKELAHNINPVIGCYEPPRSGATEGMTDEQKEEEAMHLVNLIDRLNRQGCIQPVRVGADGKIHPVEHVLELQEGIDPTRFEQNGDDASSGED